jgi:hypothetical protein
VPLLLLIVALVVVASLLFWWSNTRISYRIKYRPNVDPEDRGRRISHHGPNWRDMLD